MTSEDRAGFLTAYYEPEFPASLAPTEAMTMALLTPPNSAVSDTTALPDRAAIEDGTLGALTRPIAYLDPVDAFTVHVQGSARLRLEDGSSLRVGYAGRNGQPYTSVARLLAEHLGVEPATMDADRTVAWLKRNRPEGVALMRANRSYIFFKLLSNLAESDGPIGAAGVPLSSGRSVAVDSAAWSYGLPIWLEGTLPRPEGRTAPLARLTIAQDTGAAIRGRRGRTCSSAQARRQVGRPGWCASACASWCCGRRWWASVRYRDGPSTPLPQRRRAPPVGRDRPLGPAARSCEDAPAPARSGRGATAAADLGGAVA